MKQKNNFPYFSIRADSKKLFMDLTGYWSYPIFVRGDSDQVMWMYIVLATKTDRILKKHYLFRPHAMLLTPPNSKQIIKYDNFRYGHNLFPKVSWDTVLGYFPHHDIKDMKVEDFEAKEQLLLQYCVTATEAFKHHDKIAEEFIVFWRTMCNPVFSDFIKCLAPEFYSLIWSDADEIQW